MLTFSINNIQSSNVHDTYNLVYAYNTNKIDVSTFTPESDLSPFKGLTSELWNVSLNEEK